MSFCMSGEVIELRLSYAKYRRWMHGAFQLVPSCNNGAAEIVDFPFHSPFRQRWRTTKSKWLMEFQSNSFRHRQSLQQTCRNKWAEMYNLCVHCHWCWVAQLTELIMSLFNWPVFQSSPLHHKSELLDVKKKEREKLVNFNSKEMKINQKWIIHTTHMSSFLLKTLRFIFSINILLLHIYHHKSLVSTKKMKGFLSC